MSYNLAPIGVSTYARPEHLRRAIEALKNNVLATESDLYIFSDAPRSGDELRVEAVRKYLRTIDGFKSVTIVERKINDRVANSRGGVNQLLDEFGRVIFFAEDVVTAPGFLTFMNEALKFYENNQRLYSISGYTPPLNIPADYQHDVFFLRRFNPWGFGTWKDRFKIEYISPAEFKKFISDRRRVREFINGGGEDMLRMLKKDAYGEIDAGDVKAMYTQYLNDQYTVYPVKSLTKNIGFDGSGEHCGINDKYNTDIWSKVSDFKFIDHVKPDERIVKLNYELHRTTLRQRITRFTKDIGLFSYIKHTKDVAIRLFSLFKIGR